MIIGVAIGAGLTSAVAYGVSAAVQHDTAHTGGESAAGLRGLLRDPRWWASVAGDSLGVVLQLVALAFGPVVLVQPLFVACLLVALPVRRRLGGPPVTRRDIRACVLLVAGLAALFALLGSPGDPRAIGAGTSTVLCVVTVVAGALVAAAARGLSEAPRAVAWSVVAGGFFGVEAVLVNVVSEVWRVHGLAAFGRVDGLVPVVGAVVIGLSGFVLSLVAFQVGSLGASFPAMLVVDPVVAVVLGASLLGEHVSTSPGSLVGYAACLVAIAAATVLLASPAAERPQPVAH